MLHLKISEQRMAKNSCRARMIFLHIPLFHDSLKELLAAVGKKYKWEQAVNEKVKVQSMHLYSWISTS